MRSRLRRCLFPPTVKGSLTLFAVTVFMIIPISALILYNFNLAILVGILTLVLCLLSIISLIYNMIRDTFMFLTSTIVIRVHLKL